MNKTLEPIATDDRDGFRVEMVQGSHSLWMLVHWPKTGRVALRCGYCPDGGIRLEGSEKDGKGTIYRFRGAAGLYTVRVEFLDKNRPILRITTSITPEYDLTMPFWPSDIYPLDDSGDPIPTEGTIHAAQRGSAAGLVFLTLTKPAAGSLLYVQELTSLNPFFEKTGTDPNTRVGGRWPEMGYVPPPFADTCLPGGEKVTNSDAIINLSRVNPDA